MLLQAMALRRTYLCRRLLLGVAGGVEAPSQGWSYTFFVQELSQKMFTSIGDKIR
jgi:hypothetical protein